MQRKVPQGRADEERLTDDIIELADQYGRYGYRMVTGMLNNAGWEVNHKRVERIWRREGLKVPQKQKKKGRLWLNDGSCVRLRPERPNHVWSYDFVQDRTADGRVYRTLNIIDEYTREALMIRVDRKLNSTDVLDALTDLFILRGPPEYIRSDNGPEFIAQKVRDWIGAVGAKTAYIEPGSPWENGYCESFNARFRDELLNGEIFYGLREAQILIKNGATTTTRSGRTALWATAHPRRKASFRWTRGQRCTNNQTGPPDGGTPGCFGGKVNIGRICFNKKVEPMRATSTVFHLPLS